MRDVEYGNRDPEYASWLQNLFPVDPVNGGPVAARPGFTLTTGTPATAGAATQLLYEYVQTPTTTLVVGIFAGEIYTASAGVWTRVVTSANLATAGVTLSTTAKCYAVTYTGLMVISDGTNRPFTWDGTSGAGGLSLISNASGAWYGAPFVYYAKLGGIQAADRTTFEWSEENAPNTGYEAGGYTNAWTLTQTSSQPLSRMLGTNNALFYWRTRGVGVILGAMNTDFQTSGVHDAVSSELGTLWPNSVLLVGSTIFFMDQWLRPWALPVGGAPVPIWQQIERQFANLGGRQTGAQVFTPLTGGSWETTMLVAATGGTFTHHKISAVHVPIFNQVVFFLPITAIGAVPTHTIGLAFSPTTFAALGYWDVPWGCSESLSTSTSAPNDNAWSPYTLYVGGTSGANTIGVGYTVAKDSMIDDSGFVSGNYTGPEWRVIGPQLGWDARRRFDFREVDWVVRQRSTSTEYSYSSRYFTSELPTTAVAAAAQTFTQPTTNLTEHKTTVGVGGLGRWLAPMLTISPGSTETTTPALVHGCSVLARPVAPEGAAR